MSDEKEEYLRPGKVKKEVDQEKYSEFQHNVEDYERREDKKIVLKEIVEIYKRDYKYLPSDADEQILEIIKEQDSEKQANLLLDITSINISFGTLSTFYIYWTGNSELVSNPIFKDSSFEKRHSYLVNFRNLWSKIYFRPMSLPSMKLMIPQLQTIAKLYINLAPAMALQAQHTARLYQIFSQLIYRKIESIETTEPIGLETTLVPEDLPEEDFWNSMRDSIEEIKETTSETLEVVNHIRLAVQLGFAANIESDEKILKALLKDDSHFQFIREELLEILAERAIFREIAGIKQNLKFLKKLWSAVSAIETIGSLVLIFQVVAPEAFQLIFG